MMNILDLPEARLRFPSAARLAADHDEDDAYYHRQSIHDSCAMAAFCFLAMLVVAIIGVVLQGLGWSVA